MDFSLISLIFARIDLFNLNLMLSNNTRRGKKFRQEEQLAPGRVYLSHTAVYRLEQLVASHLRNYE